MSKGSTAMANKSSSTTSKGSVSYTSVLVGLLAVGAAYMYFDRTSTLNQFSAAMTEKLCDMLPHHKKDLPQAQAPSENAQQEAAPTVVPNTFVKESTINPKPYDAKDAMDARYHHLRDVCNGYTDVMRPESSMQNVLPHLDDFMWDSGSNVAMCTPYGVGKKAFEALFIRHRTAEDSYTSDMSSLKGNYKTANKKFRKVIMARHPMERVLSIYRLEYGRKHFAAFTDASKGGQTNDENAVSFGDFVHLVVNGPRELAEFIVENKLEGQSLGMDTGMVDGKGESKKWDSYWHQCGLCHPDFKPHYILHFEHAEEDEKVLVELMGNKETAQKWLDVKRKSYVSDEAVIKHFYGELTKKEIDGIYQKYRVDFELFGYTPDYFMQFAKDF